MDARPRDKLRITAGPSRGERAVIEEVLPERLLVRLSDTNKVVPVAEDDVLNFSAAARKAWKTMPARNVGRPRGQTVDRVSVTVRLDRALWDRFRRLEAKGAIADRSDFLEAALTHAIRRLGGRKSES
jgi:hypothetical protein